MPYPHWNYNHGQGKVGALTNQVWTWPKSTGLVPPQPQGGMGTVADAVSASSSPLDPSHFSGLGLSFQLFTPHLFAWGLSLITRAHLCTFKTGQKCQGMTPPRSSSHPTADGVHNQWLVELVYKCPNFLASWVG